MVVPPPLETAPVSLGYSPPAQTGSSGLAIAALVLGVCGFIPVVGILTALVGIVLGIIVLAKHRPGKGLAIGGIASGAVSLLVIHALMVSILVPSLSRARGLAKRAVCAANLHQFGVAVQAYMFDNEETAPPDLDTLVDYGITVSSLLSCPSRTVAGNVDYFYFPSPAAARGNPLMACDFKANHAGEGRSVLLADASVIWLIEADFQAKLSKPENAAFAAALADAEGP